MAKSLSDSRLNVPGEFVLYEVEQRFTRESGKVQNDDTTGSSATFTSTDLTGQPVKGLPGAYEFANAANVTTGGLVTGFIVDGPAIVTALAADADTDFPYAVLARGSALIADNLIPALDVYGSAITKADYITDANLLGIEVRDVAATSSTQTT